jgi:hypothetical protein
VLAGALVRHTPRQGSCAAGGLPARGSTAGRLEARRAPVGAGCLPSAAARADAGRGFGAAQHRASTYAAVTHTFAHGVGWRSPDLCSCAHMRTTRTGLLQPQQTSRQGAGANTHTHTSACWWDWFCCAQRQQHHLVHDMRTVSCTKEPEQRHTGVLPPRWL